MRLLEGGGNQIGSVPMASRASEQPAGRLGVCDLVSHFMSPWVCGWAVPSDLLHHFGDVTPMVSVHGLSCCSP
jgi:hypothetical protein